MEVSGVCNPKKAGEKSMQTVECLLSSLLRLALGNVCFWGGLHVKPLHSLTFQKPQSSSFSTEAHAFVRKC